MKLALLFFCVAVATTIAQVSGQELEGEGSDAQVSPLLSTMAEQNPVQSVVNGVKKVAGEAVNNVKNAVKEAGKAVGGVVNGIKNAVQSG